MDSADAMNFVDGTIFPLGDGTFCQQRYDLSTNPIIRHIDSANGTLSMVRAIHLVDGTTHPLGRWHNPSTWSMVRPNGRTYLDTTYGLGRW
jgi:hypothetical protein